MALFCDFENVALGVRDTQHDKFDIKRVLERLLLKGSIVVKKAYCDWDRYKQFKAPMHEANFELIEIPHVRQSGKNSADIRLVVDALDLCYTKSHVDTFVIISGDSDFSPLVSKLRENNKQVIGVGVKQSTSDLLIANCDEFIFYDDLVREGQRQAARRAEQQAPRRPAEGGHHSGGDHRRGGGGKEDSEARRVKAFDLVVETLEALGLERGDGGKVRASVLKDAIKRRRPDFNENYFGFRSFGGLLEEGQARGLLEVVRDDKGNNAYVQRASGGAAPAQPPRGEGRQPPSHPPQEAAPEDETVPQAEEPGEAATAEPAPEPGQEEARPPGARRGRGGSRSRGGRGRAAEPVEADQPPASEPPAEPAFPAHPVPVASEAEAPRPAGDGDNPGGPEPKKPASRRKPSTKTGSRAPTEKKSSGRARKPKAAPDAG